MTFTAVSYDIYCGKHELSTENAEKVIHRVEAMKMLVLLLSLLTPSIRLDIGAISCENEAAEENIEKG